MHQAMIFQTKKCYFFGARRFKGGTQIKASRGCYLNPLRKLEGGGLLFGGATIWGTLFENRQFSFLNHFPLFLLQKDYFDLHF